MRLKEITSKNVILDRSLPASGNDSYRYQ